MGAAAARWSRLVRARLDEMEALQPGQGLGPAFWDGFADRHAERTRHSAPFDPLLRRALGLVDPATVVVDVGAGSGRLSLPLADAAAEVVAVDSSARMLELLGAAAAERGVGNVRPVLGCWEEVEGVRGDVVVCAFVIPLIAEVAPFLARLTRAARRRVLVSMNGTDPQGILDVLWRHFHGRRRCPAPTWLDAVAVLRELGAEPDVEIGEVPVRGWDRFDDAVDDNLRQLLLGEEARDELGDLLRVCLLDDGGRYRFPSPVRAVAVLSWRPGRRR